MQETCCSNSILNSFEQHRQAGAMARAMLVKAAAQRWQVPPDEITGESGVVEHLRSSQQATFGDLALLPATMPPPPRGTLKDPKDFKLIGPAHLPRVDSKPKSNGTPWYPIAAAL